MGKRARMVILLGMLAGGASFGRNSEQTFSPTIHVCILNYAGVPDSALAKARSVGGRIFQHAGVTLDWLPAADSGIKPVSCDDSAGKAVLFLRLIPKSMAEKLPTYPAQFGFALLTRDVEFPSNAYIFVDKVKEFVGTTTISEPLLLGHVLAHELGHLLLGTNSHSRDGIMRGYWGPDATPDINLRGLYFSRGEAKRMRSKAEERRVLMARKQSAVTLSAAR